MPLEPGDAEDPEDALREVRRRFIAAFSGQCDSLATLLAGAAGEPARTEAAKRIVHRLTGLAGTVGFPTVSLRASELDTVLSVAGFDAARALDLLSGMREAYAADLARPPEWAAVGPQASSRALRTGEP